MSEKKPGYLDGGWKQPRRYLFCHGTKIELDPEETYMVLLLTTDPHARAAALAYADSVEAENAVFARDIRETITALEAVQEECGL